MLKYLNDLLQPFRSCFSRQATFEWFIILVVGFMLRSDHLGVTSVIRDLSLNGRCYETLIHFFRSSGWSTSSLRQRWLQVVRQHAPLLMIQNRVVLVGDGMKQAKEGRRMPGVKKLHQESENVAKGEYIFGHLFGAIGILVGDSRKWYGVQTILGWKKSESEVETPSHVVQMIEQGFEVAKGFGQALLLLDRYFLSVPALERLNACHLAFETRMHLVTKAKSKVVAYERPPAKKPGRGRPPKKGQAVKLKELFATRAADFQPTTLQLYGKEETVQFLCLDLLWGQGLYQELRFVLVVHEGCYSILVSTDLSLEAPDIIRLYSYRFKIESMFREMKQVIHAFGYRFWSKSMPKLNRFLRKEEAHPLEVVTNEQNRQRIQKTIQATEGFVMCQCIAMGLLQLVALQFSGRTSGLFFRYLRTPSHAVVSEASVAAYLRKSIFCLFAQNPHLSITKIIKSKQENADVERDSLVS
ncbi:transposase [Bacillus sp. FJAT-27264]|uniref:transposase n=1 Tax=Paenibacillus sp. (strain DSM 101736 / FJAT-27264) TaxID=1850362 RepID=UPI000807DE2C|nr:transposase [Bacillus sp. FJAT-27264]OBZ14190.1 transposase [Bacillus sp. FJAT-27264]